jgi:hypothetical protein
MTQTQRQQVLEYIKKNASEDFRLAYHEYKNAWWRYYTKADTYRKIDFNHRDIFPNEVVLDFDEEDIETNAHYASKVIVFLKEKKIKHSVFYTGGKGVHIHCFFKGIEKASENKLIKTLLTDWMTGCIDISIDKQLMGRHLVRMEFGHHESKMPERVYKVPIGDSFKDHFTLNNVPKFIWKQYEEKILFFALRRMQYQQEGVKITGIPLCLKYLMSDEFAKHRDGGKRAIFAIASYYRNLPDRELGELLLRYNKYVLKEPLLREQLYQQIKSVRKHKGRHVGCSYRHTLLREVGAGEVACACEAHKRKEVTEKDGEQKT